MNTIGNRINKTIATGIGVATKVHRAALFELSHRKQSFLIYRYPISFIGLTTPVDA